MENDLKADIAAIANFDAVPTILDVVCRTTGMGFAAIARVTEDRWIACKVLDTIKFGLPDGGELKVETTICDEIRESRKPVIIDNVSEDDVYRDHHTPATYGIQSYISMPIVLENGKFFGTLCAIDPRPARVNRPEIIGLFEMFARLIAYHLNSEEELVRMRTSLNQEKQNAELREQFIAVLGHDLRNPLGAISTAAALLERMGIQSERTMKLAGLIKESASRMAGLIEDVLDFARGRMGGGIHVNRAEKERLEPLLKQVLAELRASSPEKEIIADFSLGKVFNCDSRRIAQLFSNLLGNALSHGTPHTPIKVRAVTEGHYFKLSVANAAKQIPAATMERLFHPFCRGDVIPHQEGLGLGLYIASEIAKAHKGTLNVTSSAAETCFTFTMPMEENTAQVKNNAREVAA